MKGLITRRRNLRYTPEGFVPAPQPLFPAAAIGPYLQGERMLREEVAEWITTSCTLERQLVLDMKIADKHSGLSAAERRSIAAALTPEVNAMIAQARLEGYSVMPFAARLQALDTAGIPVRLGLSVLLPGLADDAVTATATVAADGSLSAVSITLRLQRTEVSLCCRDTLPGSWPADLDCIRADCFPEPEWSADASAMLWQISTPGGDSSSLTLSWRLPEVDFAELLACRPESFTARPEMSRPVRLAIRPARKCVRVATVPEAELTRERLTRWNMCLRHGDTMILAGMVQGAPKVDMPQAIVTAWGDDLPWICAVTVGFSDGTLRRFHSGGSRRIDSLSELVAWPESDAVWLTMTVTEEGDVVREYSARLLPEAAGHYAVGRLVEGAVEIPADASVRSEVCEPGMIAAARLDGEITDTALTGMDILSLAGAARSSSTWGFGCGHVYGLCSGGILGIAVTGRDRRLSVSLLTAEGCSGLSARADKGEYVVTASADRVLLLSGTGCRTAIRRPGLQITAIACDAAHDELALRFADGSVEVFDAAGSYMSDAGPSLITLMWPSSRRGPLSVLLTAREFHGSLELFTAGRETSTVARWNIDGPIRSPLRLGVPLPPRWRHGITIEGTGTDILIINS